MKSLKELTVIAVMLLFVSGFSGCNTYENARTSRMQTNYENPEWAPPYYDGERYFYLPDIESYYDLASREFIFLDNGQWRYSQYIPSIYEDFNLYNCFVIVVNYNIYQPWMHHQYFLSHYPRYYYRDYYDRSNFPYVRGFNENSRSAIYWPENQRDRARSWDNENLNNNRQFRYTKEDRQHQMEMNNQFGNQHTPGNRNYNQNPGNNPDQTGNQGNNQGNGRYQNQNNRTNQAPGNNTNQPGNQGNNQGNGQNQNQNNRTNQAPGNNTNQPGNQGNSQGNGQNQNQNNRTNQAPGNNTPQQGTNTQPDRTHETNYYGRPIGQPVKVERQMKNQDNSSSSDKSSSNTREGNTRSNSGRR